MGLTTELLMEGAIAFVAPLVSSGVAIAIDRAFVPAFKRLKNTNTARALAKVDNWLTPDRLAELMRLLDLLGIDESGAIATIACCDHLWIGLHW